MVDKSKITGAPVESPNRQKAESIVTTTKRARRRRGRGTRDAALELAAHGGRHTVLVIDHNAATRRAVRLFLSEHGFRVVEAADAGAAVGLMELERPQLVLQSLTLPETDALELVRELRKRAGSAKTAVLGLAGFLTNPDVRGLHAAGFDDVIHRPIDEARLVRRIEAHLSPKVASNDRFGSGRRVLVADDDPMRARLLRMNLERLGFRVTTVDNGLRALDAARRLRPDILIAEAMMSRLDGFGLSILLRQEPTLSALTIVLVAPDAVSEDDRAHARRSGANRLVPRASDPKELIQILRGSTLAPEAPPRVMPEALLGLEQERSQRLLTQLERRDADHQRLTRRCSLLAAELNILSQLSQAMLESSTLDGALDEAFAACLEAGGLSLVSLFLLEEDGAPRVHALARSAFGPDPASLGNFFGNASLLGWTIQRGEVLEIPSRHLPTDLCIQLLQSSGASNLLVVPLTWRQRPVGALVLIAREPDLDLDGWRSFAQGVASHVTLSLALHGHLSFAGTRAPVGGQSGAPPVRRSGVA